MGGVARRLLFSGKAVKLFSWIKKEGSEGAQKAFILQYLDEGLVVAFSSPLETASIEALFDTADGMAPSETYLVAYLSQLVVEERCRLTTEKLTLPWELVYQLLADEEHKDCVETFELPAPLNLAPILDCNGTLSDANFEIFVDGWVSEGQEIAVSAVRGAVASVGGRQHLLPENGWKTSDAIAKFKGRSADLRNQHEHELAWGRIRAVADAANALYRTPYLETTIVLTPQTLRLPLTRSETAFGRVVTVEPTFEGAPKSWIRTFDGFKSVQPHYDVTPDNGGHMRIVLSEPVRQVLTVLKREMPTRTVAGKRAQAFIHNPWAFIGEAATGVILEDEFAQDKAGAGALETNFSLHAVIKDSRIEHIDLRVTEHLQQGSMSNTERLDSIAAAEEFLAELSAALQKEMRQISWRQYDLSIDGNSAQCLEEGRAVVATWKAQPALGISFEDIYELDGYSNRIAGIGVAKAIYVPLIQKPAGDGSEGSGWIPSDLNPMVRVTLAGHEGQVVIPLTKEWVDQFGEQVRAAERDGSAEIVNSALPTSVPTSQARALFDGFRAMLDAPEKIKATASGKEKQERKQKESLLVKMNFHKVDYAEERKANLAVPEGAKARLPRSLRASITLKNHQFAGVAWFQHLVSRAPIDCRGALLADDMGLGKTLQLLALLGRYYEEHPDAPPSMILVPKSLLENWQKESVTFFGEGFPPVLVLYGEELTRRKQPLSLIDQRLQAKDVVELLRPDWAAKSKIIITTYEVLVSYEFSFARQPFAFLVCDEAQRIKTPGTQAAIAVRALKADFRIVCTGTPVENSLADLWALFDFVQPGLLGGLEEFGRKYRRPIECETDDQKAALKLLQDAIGPQTLRRTKAELKHEFKRKLFACRKLGESQVSFKEKLEESDRLEVLISDHQEILYLGGLKKLQDASEEQDTRRRARASFGALHLMKAVCAEPYCIPGRKFKAPTGAGHDEHLRNSAKLADLIEHLRHVEEAQEKAIIFTELREVQLCLFYFMKHVFGLKPSIINGDTESRQSYIDRFSERPGFDVIILSTLAAGAGLNVTAANHVFHFTRAWNPAKESQATDRAYRIGQQRDVFVYCPIIVADTRYTTFDVRLDEMLRRKAGLADATLGDSALEAMLNGSGADVSMADLMSGEHPGGKLEKRLLTMDDVDRLDGFSFEVLCMILWSKKGYISQVTPKKGGDGGIDVLAVKGKEGELLQCKSSSGGEVGWDAVKEVTAGSPRYQAGYPGTLFRKIIITNQRFNANAHSQAELNRVIALERRTVSELLTKFPIDNFEFDQAVFDCLPLQDVSWKNL
jgi:HJR/Mrr/RecB family endonuclease